MSAIIVVVIVRYDVMCSFCSTAGLVWEHFRVLLSVVLGTCSFRSFYRNMYWHTYHTLPNLARFHVKGNKMAQQWKKIVWFWTDIWWFLTIIEHFILSLVDWQLLLVACHRKKIIETIPNHRIGSHNWNKVKKIWFSFLSSTVMIGRQLHETNDQDVIA